MSHPSPASRSSAPLRSKPARKGSIEARTIHPLDAWFAGRCWAQCGAGGSRLTREEAVGSAGRLKGGSGTRLAVVLVAADGATGGGGRLAVESLCCSLVDAVESRCLYGTTPSKTASRESWLGAVGWAGEAMEWEQALLPGFALTGFARGSRSRRMLLSPRPWACSR
jgi:hypothetical protein